MAQQQVFNSIWVPETFADTTGRLEVLCAHAVLPAAASNSLLFTAVTGKKIAILGYSLASQGAVTGVRFKNGSGGANIHFAQVPANSSATPNVIIAPGTIPIFTSGTGIGIYVDTGAVEIEASFTYLIFEP